VTVETKKKDPLEEPREAPKFDLDDPELTRFDLVREGARRDGVEIVHYAPRFPVAGTRAEKRIERTIAFFFLLAGAAATAFVVFFVAWPWEYGDDSALTKYYTPLLGLTLGIALLSIGVAVIIYAKKLLPESSEVDDTLGWVYYKKDLASLAIPPLEDSLKRRPNDPSVLYHLGMTYAKFGNKAKSREVLERALKLDLKPAYAASARQTLAAVQ